MREIIDQTQFRKDFKKMKKSGRFDVKDLLSVIEKLANENLLDAKHRDHQLTGDYIDCRECHVRPDTLLIYKLEPGQLILVRVGSHSELFD